MAIFSKKKRKNKVAESATQRPKKGEQSGYSIGVLASQRALSRLDSKVLDAPCFLKERRDESRQEALGRFLDADADLILVLGPDALVGEVLTLHRRHFSAHRTPLNLAVMAVGAVHTVADALGSGVPTSKALKQLMSALESGALRRRRLPMLKITSSVLPASQYGFACGAGLFYDIFESFHRGGADRSNGVLAASSVLGGMAKRLVFSGSAALKPVQARISIDGQPYVEEFGFWLAGSLESSWFGLHLSADSASFRSGDSPKELLAQVTQSRVQPSFLRSMRAAGSDETTAFKRIHMDGSAGYVLDGELFDPNRPYTLQIKSAAPAVFHTV